MNLQNRDAPRVYAHFREVILVYSFALIFAQNNGESLAFVLELVLSPKAEEHEQIELECLGSGGSEWLEEIEDNVTVQSKGHCKQNCPHLH